MLSDCTGEPPDAPKLSGEMTTVTSHVDGIVADEKYAVAS